MTYIPAGTLTKPPANNAYWTASFNSVSLSAFRIGKYEVTQKLWEEIMGNNPSNFPDDPQRPVEKVGWYDTLVFCNKLSVKNGFTPVYSIDGSTDTTTWGTVPTNESTKWNNVTIVAGNGYRLPTEAQWEYACRAGTTTLYSFGDEWDSAYGNTRSNSESAIGWDGKTAKVGSFLPNPWGLYDMHGNVDEWCWDKAGGFGEYYPSGEVDPTGGNYGNRVLRGGDYYYTASQATSMYRANGAIYARGTTFGLRVVR
jgi:formylglycine-generating enzyme required for sulfatase activity